jgi:hypothetical protein
LGFGLITAGFFFFSQLINVYYVGLLVLLYQQLYVIPRVSKLYCKLNNLEYNNGRFIPLWNEYQIFTPSLGRITLIVGLILIFMLILAIIPLSGIIVFTQLVNTVLGESASMTYVFYLLLFSIVVYIVLNVIRGMGFIEIKRYVERVYFINFGTPPGKLFNKFQYLMFFFPFLRTLALALLSETLTKMVAFNEIQLENTDNFEETFE